MHIVLDVDGVGVIVFVIVGVGVDVTPLTKQSKLASKLKFHKLQYNLELA